MIRYRSNDTYKCAVVVAKVETMQWHEQSAVRRMTRPDMGHVGAVVTQPRHRHHTWHQGVTRDMDHIKHCLRGRSSGNILRLSQYSVSFCCSLLLPTDIINLVFWHVKTSKSPHSNSLKTSHFWARYPLTTLHTPTTQQTHDLEIVGRCKTPFVYSGKFRRCRTSFVFWQRRRSRTLMCTWSSDLHLIY